MPQGFVTLTYTALGCNLADRGIDPLTEISG